MLRRVAALLVTLALGMPYMGVLAAELCAERCCSGQMCPLPQKKKAASTESSQHNMHSGHAVHMKVAAKANAAEGSVKDAEADCHKAKSSKCRMNSGCDHKEQSMVQAGWQWSPVAFAALHVPPSSAETIQLPNQVPLKAFLSPLFQPPRV